MSMHVYIVHLSIEATSSIGTCALTSRDFDEEDFRRIGEVIYGASTYTLARHLCGDFFLFCFLLDAPQGRAAGIPDSG